MVDGEQRLVALVTLTLELGDLQAVHLVAVGAGRGVRHAIHRRGLPFAGVHHPAGLVRQILARVRDHLI